MTVSLVAASVDVEAAAAAVAECFSQTCTSIEMLKMMTSCHVLLVSHAVCCYCMLLHITTSNTSPAIIKNHSLQRSMSLCRGVDAPSTPPPGIIDLDFDADFYFTAFYPLYKVRLAPVGASRVGGIHG